MSLAYVILILLGVYQLKHFLSDYILQGEYMLGKFKPGWDFLGPLFTHVLVHGLMTFAIAGISFMVLDPGMLADAQFFAAGGIALLDMGVHFIMDRIKASPAYMGRWKPLVAAEYVQIKRILAEAAAGGAGSEDFRAQAQLHSRLRGNKLFWWALGFDQMIHHLTHYACIYTILHAAGAL
jgi:hypothetical protein